MVRQQKDIGIHGLVWWRLEGSCSPVNAHCVEKRFQWTLPGFWWDRATPSTISLPFSRTSWKRCNQVGSVIPVSSCLFVAPKVFLLFLLSLSSWLFLISCSWSLGDDCCSCISSFHLFQIDRPDNIMVNNRKRIILSNNASSSFLYLDGSLPRFVNVLGSNE